MMKIDLRRINIYCAGSKGWIFNAYIISAEHTVGRFVQRAHTIIMLMPLFNRRSTRRPHYNFIACTWGRKQRKTHATCNLSSAPFIFGAKCTHLRVWITTTAGIYANKFLLLSHSRQMTLRCGDLSKQFIARPTMMYLRFKNDHYHSGWVGGGLRFLLLSL